MDGLRELGEMISTLMEVAYSPDSSDRECWHSMPGKRGGTRETGIRVHNHRAAGMLDAVNRELLYMSRKYLEQLEREL